MKTLIVVAMLAVCLGYMSGCGELKPVPPEKKNEQKAAPAAGATAKPAPAGKNVAAPHSPPPPPAQPATGGKASQPDGTGGKVSSATVGVGVGDFVDYGMGKTQLEIKQKKGGQVQQMNNDHNKKMNDLMK